MSFGIFKMFSAQEANVAAKKAVEKGYDKNKFNEILSEIINKVKRRAKEGSFSAYCSVFEFGFETIHPSTKLSAKAVEDMVSTLQNLGYEVEYRFGSALKISWK